MYGTLCFAGTEPREQSFSETEQSLISLFQRWIGYEIDRKIAQTNRREQQERLDMVLSGTGTGIAEWDLRTDEVVWDETFQENFGRNPETLEAFTEIVHPDDRDRVEERLDEMIETGEQWDDAFRVITGSGEVAWYGMRAIPVCEDGEPVKVLATGTDATERKQREQALAESRERYETLLQAAPDPVFVADDVTGEIVETNAAAAALRGEPQEEIIGRHLTELHPSDKTEAHKAAFTRALQCDGQITELSDGTQPKLCTVDDETVPVEIAADTVDLPDGPVIYSVFRDVSERVENERELELKERAMDEANVGITISDPYTPDNPIIYVNQGFVDQTGYSREEAVGLNCRFLQGDDRDQQALDTLREAVMDEEPVTVDLRNYRRNGELFWNRLSVTPVYDETGTLANYIGIQQEVTEEKLREQRLRALHETTRELLQTEEVNDAATVAADVLFEELDVDLAGIYLRDGDELVQNTVLGAVPEQVPERIERGRTPLWEAIESGDTVVHNEFADLDDGIDREELAATAYFPIQNHGAVIVGALDQPGLSKTDRKLIEVLVGNLVAVLDTLKRQHQLRDEREQFRLLTESVDEYAFIIVDEASRIETWDQSAQNIFGYDSEAAIGMSVGQLHPETDRESGLPKRLIQQARIAGESAHEGWQVRADGTEFYADTHVAPLETDDGEVQGYAMIVRDMTDRRQRERRTELFVQESDDVVSILEPDGTFSYVSGSSERVLGHDPDDLLGENFFDYVHPGDREPVMEVFFSSTDDPDSVVRSECRFESGAGE
ncbi:PAS domain S-box protein [Halohasta salina]|uniref:PAS domain S-box protein n=1 Tax=Halohasta salina TaxID=2961621 RepID=UPI0020A33BFA|nr:PAS domain S-box protein [Halohasta salina]